MNTAPDPADTLVVSLPGREPIHYVTRAAYDDLADRLDEANDALYRILVAAAGIPTGVAWQPDRLAADIERWRAAAEAVPLLTEVRWTKGTAQQVAETLRILSRLYGTGEDPA